MPLYDYSCPQHGNFSRLLPLARRNEEIGCPDCGGLSERVISAPRLALMNPQNRNAWERNERSAHEPLSAKKHSCSHHHHGTEHKHHAKQTELKRGAINGRPWMLGH